VTPIVIQLEPIEEAPLLEVLRPMPDPAWSPDAEGKMWLRSLTSARYRSNVLLQCSSGDIVAAAVQIAGLCTHPFRLCLTSGCLDLPERGSGGTLIIGDVSTLSIEQQIALYDWMDDRQHPVQVISITSVPLLPLVRSGRFLEGLFYRLNVLCAAVVGPGR
jgi:transcriptional regulator of aromatic amino acid metabolism